MIQLQVLRFKSLACYAEQTNAMLVPVRPRLRKATSGINYRHKVMKYSEVSTYMARSMCRSPERKHSLVSFFEALPVDTSASTARNLFSRIPDHRAFFGLFVPQLLWKLAFYRNLKAVHDMVVSTCKTHACCVLCRAPHNTVDVKTKDGLL